MRFLDYAVLAAISLVLLFSVAIVLIGRACGPWLEQHVSVFNVAGVFLCVLLLVWMFRGGSLSPLWSWMPPFCMVPNIKWVRWLWVIAMCVGTVSCIISGF